MKFRKNERTQRTVRFAANVICILVHVLFFYVIWMRVFNEHVIYARRGYILYFAIYAASLTLFNSVFGGFNLGYSTTGDLIFSQVLSSFFSLAVIYLQVSIVIKHFLGVGELFVLFLIDVAISVILCVLANRIYYRLFPPKETLMIYEKEDQSIYDRILKYQSDSYDIRKKEPFTEFSKHMEELEEYQCAVGVGLKPEQKEQLVKYAYDITKPIYLLPDIYDVLINGGKNVYLVDTPMYIVNNFGPSQLEKIVKRIFDIVFSLVLLVIMSPFLLITALAVKLQDGGPVFYKQTRLTQYGREFEIIKFRSMRVDAEKEGGAQLAKENDDRITKVGKFIRATRLDEFPQLFNILKGDMSVVGPRPERPELAAKIEEKLPEFHYRLKVKAGLTGYAQVYGKYNTKLKDKLLFDLIYIEHYSLVMDIRILFLTFKIVFKKESTEGVTDNELHID